MVVDTRQAYDSLLLLYIVIAVVAAAVIYAWMAFVMVRYRDRGEEGDGDGDGEAGGEAGGETGGADAAGDAAGGDGDGARRTARLPPPPPASSGSARRPTAILTLTVAAILMAITLNGINAFSVISEPPDVPDAVHVHANAFQFGWSFAYDNGNTTNGVMYVPTGRVVEVTVTSTDVFHSLGIPDFRVKADAIPGQTNELWFLAGQPGSHPVYCMELCGTGHNSMHAVLEVLTEAEWDAWVAGYTGP